ncbi:MAG: phytanoyl-CoA dioxygenase family protein [Thiolinea sp.]
MPTLTKNQIDTFHREGYLLLENAIAPDMLKKLQQDFERWKEESRQYSESYGNSYDGRPRFSLEPGHSAEQPALRRIASPVEISDNYLAAMRDNRALDALQDLIGPNIKFENAKVNSKQPGAATTVKYHQDFAFEAHTNDDMVTVLFFIDDVTEDNGPLKVVPGSHTGPIYEHWHHGIFTGAVSETVDKEIREQAVPCFGKAGSACLMHTRVVHGSEPNLSDGPRTLFICSYTAEDAYPLHSNHIPSEYQYEVVRGEATGRVRCTPYEMAIAEMPTGASFFEQQAKEVA